MWKKTCIRHDSGVPILLNRSSGSWDHVRTVFGYPLPPLRYVWFALSIRLPFSARGYRYFIDSRYGILLFSDCDPMGAPSASGGPLEGQWMGRAWGMGKASDGFGTPNQTLKNLSYRTRYMYLDSVHTRTRTRTRSSQKRYCTVHVV